jgi:hypothetical protein
VAAPSQPQYGSPPAAQSLRRAHVSAARQRVVLSSDWLIAHSDKKALAELSLAIKTNTRFATQVSLDLQVDLFFIMLFGSCVCFHQKIIAIV